MSARLAPNPVGAIPIALVALAAFGYAAWVVTRKREWEVGDVIVLVVLVTILAVLASVAGT